MFKSSKSAKTAKCKTQLRLVVSRIKLLRNKRETQVKHLRKDIAQLLQNKQDENARSRVDHAIREQNMVEAYGLIELYCDYLAPRVASLATQKTCPVDLQESIAGLIFAAPRCADLPELLDVRSIFSDMYGKHFIVSIVELRPGCGVSQKIIERLSTQPAKADRKMAYMEDVAKEYHVKWVPVDLAAQEVKRPPAPNDFKKAVDNESPKSPLRPQVPPVQPSPPSASAGISVEAETSDEEVAVARPPQRPPPPSKQTHGHHQFIPFVQHHAMEQKPQHMTEARNDPYSKYVTGSLNPYGQAPRPDRPDPSLNPYGQPARQADRPDPYAEYRKTHLANSFSDVASAAEAAAVSADHAAVAARAAAELANKELSRGNSGSSITSSGRKHVPKISPLSIEERVASYVKAHANDEDSSEWETPTPHLKEESQAVNPSRNLWSESRLLEQRKEHRIGSEGRSHSTGTIGKQMMEENMTSPKPEYDEVVEHNSESTSEDSDDGELFRHESLQPSAPEVGKPVFDQEAAPVKSAEQRRIFERRYSRQDSVTQNLESMHETFSSKFNALFEKEDLETHEVPAPSIEKHSRRNSTPKFDHPSRWDEDSTQNVDRPSRWEQDSTQNFDRPSRWEQDSTQNFDRPSRWEQDSTQNFDRPSRWEQDSTQNFNRARSRKQASTQNFGRTDEQEERWRSPEKDAEARRSGLAWQTSASELGENVFNDAENQNHLDFQKRFHGSGVDYNEKSAMRKHKIPGASVRTRRS